MTETAKIRTFIQDNLIGISDKVVFSDHDDIFELGFVSSLFAMRLINFVQEEFGIKLDDQDIALPNFRSVNNIVRLIQEKQEVKGS